MSRDETVTSGISQRDPEWRDAASQTESLFAEALEKLFATLSPVCDGRLLRAREALQNGRVEQASRIAAKVLARHPDDTDVLDLMAAIASYEGRQEESESLLARCVREKPHNRVYRYNFSLLLLYHGKIDEALEETTTLLASDSGNPLFQKCYAALLCRKREFADAAACYRRLAEDHPECPEFWSLLASTLRSMGGHSQDAVDAWRKAAALAPGMGTIWWSLASMKTFAFSQEDVDVMEHQLSRPAMSGQHRADLHFALGKAHGDVCNFEKSFQHYSRGNAIRRIDLRYDPRDTTDMVARAEAVFSPELFRKYSGAGHPSNEPIFVLGLQRAGSTLTEQILGSHSQIEGAGELQSILRIVGEDVMPQSGPDYPNGMNRLAAEDLRAMGEKYLQLSNVHRVHGKPLFVDKCPFNLWHVGLIHLIFPDARIIDVRRHPIGCCLANFTMSFAHAPPVSYRLTDIGLFYRDYVRLMDHFDRVLPGKIHRVIYERLVADIEGEVRSLLDFIGVPFEPGCLEFHKSARAFNSFSNEQVRRPIFTETVDWWRNYEPWLEPLKASLGPALDTYAGAITPLQQ
ncbi:MAG TPA: sulfotransferase [Rhizomicrobium sp.]